MQVPAHLVQNLENFEFRLFRAQGRQLFKIRMADPNAPPGFVYVFIVTVGY